MADMEKVINGLKLLAHWPDALIITDKEKWIKSCCEMAIALLKEQDKLLKHEYWRGYNNGRADERGLQEGTIMQTFSPD